MKYVEVINYSVRKDPDTGELVNFVNDGEDPIFDSRTIIASSIEDFIERSSINEFLLEFA
jgi:hypothetical protein